MAAPAAARMKPLPAMGSRQHKVAYSQFSCGVAKSLSVRPKRRKAASPKRPRIAPTIPSAIAPARQVVRAESGGSTGRGAGDVATAAASSAGSGAGGDDGRGAPHSPQKRSSLRNTAPQLSHSSGSLMVSLSLGQEAARDAWLTGRRERHPRLGNKQPSHLGVLGAKAILVDFVTP